MGCGAVSSNTQIHTPQLQYKKDTFNFKSEDTEIWECYNHKKQKFSMKVFKKIFITDQNIDGLRNFQLQINRLNQLTRKKEYQNFYTSKVRKNLMQYIKALKDQNGNLALIMKHKDGFQPKSLGDQVKGKLPGVFKQIHIAKIVKQAILTIKFLRQNSSIFCNFKPTNIFLDKSRQNIILCDYYNLQQYFKLQQLTFLKNPVYSAPQNILFKQYLQQTDIWRIGCFVIEMLTCIKPWYKETTDREKIMAHLRNKAVPPLPQKISLSCKYFLEKCFQPDHNRRVSLDELLKLDFLNTQNNPSSSKLMASNVSASSRVDNEYKVLKNSHRQNQSKQSGKSTLKNIVSHQKQSNQSSSQIGSYNLQVHLNNQQSQVIKQLKKSRLNSNGNTISIQQITSPVTKGKKFSISKKKSFSTKNNTIKKLDYSNPHTNSNNYYTQHSINDQNENNSTIEMKKSKILRNKRMKTENVSNLQNAYNKNNNSYYNEISPQRSVQRHKQSVLLQKPKFSHQQQLQQAYSPQTYKNKKSKQHLTNHSRKISRTSNFRLSNSKKKIIPTNQITLNNQIIDFHVNQNSCSKYWPAPQIPAPFDYLQTAQKLNAIMKQIEIQGGPKYYKKPLKLLKQKLRNKTTTMRTQTSITFQQTQKQDQDYNQQNQIQMINIDNNNKYMISDQSAVYNQTENSKLSFNTHEQEVIETMASKAERMRYQQEQRMLRQQRQNDKMKWEKELKQGREFIKNQINQRYYFMRNKDKALIHNVEMDANR